MQMKGTALVTGGTGGLGTAVTEALLADGWRVVVPWIVESELDRLDAVSSLELVQADLTDPGQAALCVDQAARDASVPLRAVVNLIGGFSAGGRLHETPVEEFEQQLELNLRPTYLVTQAAVPNLLAIGGGAIVCVSSRAALRPFAGASGYITAKAAVLGLVGALDAEYSREGIRANAVLPGMIDTSANRAAAPDSTRDDWVAPEDIAKVIAFLCGDSSGVVRGAHIPVHG